MAWWRSIVRKLRTWRALGPEGRRLVVRAALLCAEIDLRLRLAGFDATRVHLARRGRSAAGGERSLWEQDRMALQTARVVRSAARHLPWKVRCLTRALVAWRLLRRAGVESVVRFGVRREGAGEISGHAWIERAGRPVDPREAGSPDRFSVLEPSGPG